jgi:hypothetical protein
MKDTQTVMTRITDAFAVAGPPIRVRVLLDSIVVATDGTSAQAVIPADLDPTMAPSTFAPTMRAAIDAWASAHGYNTPVNNLFLPAYNKA